MSPWKGERKDSWASNPNIAVYIFCALFTVWLGFHIWAGIPGGPPAPQGLDPMVMAALGVAISAKSAERKQQETTLKDKVDALEDVAAQKHPDAVADHAPPLEKNDEPE